MANRIITLKVADIVSGEELTIQYDADTKDFTAGTAKLLKYSALKVTKVSDA